MIFIFTILAIFWVLGNEVLNKRATRRHQRLQQVLVSPAPELHSSLPACKRYQNKMIAAYNGLRQRNVDLKDEVDELMLDLQVANFRQQLIVGWLVVIVIFATVTTITIGILVRNVPLKALAYLQGKLLACETRYAWKTIQASVCNMAYNAQKLVGTSADELGVYGLGKCLVRDFE